MQYGHFDDERLEYVITRPDTPKPWSNYLGSTEYGAIITNHAGGYSFYRSAARGRFIRLMFNSVPLDQPGRYFYVRDDASGDYWSTSWQPVGKDPKDFKYECRHGTAYTQIDAEYSGIASESLYFVPLGRAFEVWILKLTNRSDRPRELSVFTYIEFANDWNARLDLMDLQYSQFVIKSDLVEGMIDTSYLRNLGSDLERVKTPDQGRRSFFALVGADIAGFDTRREAFIGNYRGYHNPIVVEKGECTGSLSHGDNACGTLQTKIRLAPGESREVMVLMGVGSADHWGKKTREEFSSVEHARAEFEKLKTHWHGKLKSFKTKTPDPEFDSTINVWGAYNSLITYAWSRAASLIYQGERDGLGYRDTVQDILGVLAMIPEEAKERLELMITGQVSTGGAIPVIKPFAHNPGHEPPPEHYRSDDCMWLFNTVPEYVKETGDLAFYDKVLPFADQGEATVLGHLRRALEFSIERSGVHGLPAGLGADWNDCLNLGTTGESVFVTFQLYYGLGVYLEICERLGRPDEARWANERKEILLGSIRKHTWDGAWFRRGMRADGTLIGSAQRDEGSIFLEPQPWSVISGAATPEQGVRSMDSVFELLNTDYGIMICTPPFRKDQSVGAVIFNAGQKENAAIFQHPQAWAVIAETLLGRGDRAYQYFRAYMPSAYNSRAEVREVEPYVYCQSTHSVHSRMYGISRVPWLSGTASWSYHAATHSILGIQPDYDGLLVNPCIPCDWKEFSVTRLFRGKRIEILVKNPAGVSRGVKSVTLNGKRLDGALVPATDLGTSNRVEVVLG